MVVVVTASAPRDNHRGDVHWSRAPRAGRTYRAVAHPHSRGHRRRTRPGSLPRRHGFPHVCRGYKNIYSVRYFHRDYKRRDVGYYEDTPLSLNHNLMKGKPTRPDDDPSGTLPQVNNGFAIGRAPPAENSHAWGRMPKQLGSFFTKYDTPDPRAQ